MIAVDEARAEGANIAMVLSVVDREGGLAIFMVSAASNLTPYFRPAIFQIPRRERRIDQACDVVFLPDQGAVDKQTGRFRMVRRPAR
jgi:hypothetical protein